MIMDKPKRALYVALSRYSTGITTIGLCRSAF